jgi:hypothetical protein
MGDVVNLRRVRKQKARDQQESQAAANRAKFGESKASRNLATAEQQQVTSRLDAHKREPE